MELTRAQKSMMKSFKFWKENYDREILCVSKHRNKMYLAMVALGLIEIVDSRVGCIYIKLQTII